MIPRALLIDSDMKYIDADLLRQDIERRMNDNLKAEEKYDNGLFGSAAKEDYDILARLDSLQQELESVAERFAKIVRGNLIGIDKEVQQKFESLYLEITGDKMYGGYND